MQLIRRGDAEIIGAGDEAGTAQTVAIWPEGAGPEDFLWRLTLLDVQGALRLDPMPLFDRTVALLTGKGVTLDFANTVIDLPAGPGAVSFPAELPVTLRPSGAAALALKLMSRRNRALHLVLPVTNYATAGTVAVVARGPARVGNTELAAGDCLLDGAGVGLSDLPVSGDVLAIILTVCGEG